MSIIQINPGNKALEFIDFRIKDDKYRGNPSSEHNRYTMDQIVKILILLDKYAPNKNLMKIRTTDISKRPDNEPDEFLYAQFCNEAKNDAGIGTQDAMRKNLFVDLHRMGLIERYDKNKKPTDPFSQQNVVFVSLSRQGLKLVNEKNILNKYFIFSKGIDNLLGGYINIVLDILRNEEYGIDKISIYEYMFFISAIDVPFNFGINIEKAVALIKEYRNLTSIQKRAAIETLRVELNPDNYGGSKIHKRDFGNWRNKIEQIFHLLNQTAYFQRAGDFLVLKTGQNAFEKNVKGIKRSSFERAQYFKNQEVAKTFGFELHHIIPSSWAENAYHFKLLDGWRNMLYIDGFSHAKITQNRSKNVVLNDAGNDIILADYGSNEVFLKYKINVLYSLAKKETVKEYNKELLNTLK